MEHITCFRENIKQSYFKAAYIILWVPNHLVEEYRIHKKDEETETLKRESGANN
jgi:hypothetical protein